MMGAEGEAALVKTAKAVLLIAAGVFCAQAWGLQDASGTSRGPATVTVTVADRARPISLKRGDTLEVRLESNPQSGYSWSVAPVSNPVLEQVSKSFQPSGVGSRGMDAWTFKAINRGKQRLRMQYRRPGARDDDPAAKTIFFQVVVQRER
jgi:inhibitor of cysteine peptidase